MTSAPLIDVAPALARLSALAYARQLELQRGLDREGLELIDSFAHNDTEALLVTRQGSVGSRAAAGQPGAQWAALAFRGTEASRLRWRDLASNLGAPVRWAGAGYAHSGYVDALTMIANEVVAMAEEVAGDIPLYVTGHSMGGALATLFAGLWYAPRFLRARRRGYRLAGLVTFGAPKALSAAAAAPIACPKLRLVNRFDFAPYWQPWILEHPGPAQRIDSGGWPGPVSRHPIEAYVQVLDGWRVSENAAGN